jgi:multiple sugar transport system substrate-binding protein
MMRSMKFLTWGSGAGYLLLLALLYVFTYFIFVKEQKQEVTEIYFADRVTDAHRILIDKYNALNAGRIKVIPIDFPNKDFSTNERKEILTRSLRGEGDGIDLFAVDVIWVQRFAKWCEPLGQYFSEEELKRIIPDALFSCYTDGALVAVPLDLVQGVMYYREDLLKNMSGGNEIIRALQSSMSWPEFLLLKDRLKWRGPFFVFPAAEYEGLICSYVEILLGLKLDYFSTVGFNFETQEARDALQLMVDLVQKYKAAPEVVTKFTEVSSYEYYVKNDGLFIRGWNTYDKDFQNAPYDKEKERHLRKAPLPHISLGRPASVFGGWNLMVSKFSKKKDAVIDFVKFLLRDESQEVFYSQAGFYPVTASFYNDSLSLQRHPEIAGIKEMMRAGVHRPPQKDYTNYSTIMAHYFVMAIRNEISVDEALESVNKAIHGGKSLVVTR